MVVFYSYAYSVCNVLTCNCQSLYVTMLCWGTGLVECRPCNVNNLWTAAVYTVILYVKSMVSMWLKPNPLGN